MSYSTAAGQSARSMENLLQCLVQCLRKMKETQTELPIPHSYKLATFWFFGVILKIHIQLWQLSTHWKASASPLFVCDCRGLLSEFHSGLSDIKKTKPLVILVDGVDLVQDGRGQLNSDWIPEQLPQVSYRQDKHLDILIFSLHRLSETVILFFLSGCLFGIEHHIECSTTTNSGQEKKYRPVSTGAAHHARPQGDSSEGTGHAREEAQWLCV